MVLGWFFACCVILRYILVVCFWLVVICFFAGIGGWFCCCLLFLVVCMLFLPSFSFAEDGSPSPISREAILTSLGDIFTPFIGSLISGLEYILRLFQQLFVKIVEITILDFGGYWRGEGVLKDLGALKFVWQILRDFVNLVIVVLFIVVSMLSVFGEFTYKRKVLIGLLFTAILVNFSAFVTLFLLDISHAIFALFYNGD